MTFKRKEVIGSCTLYQGDCRQVLPTIDAKFDLCTDPPYGIGAGKMSLGKWRTSRMRKLDWDANAPDEELIDMICDRSERQIIWGGNYFPLRPSRGFLVWDKGNGFKGRDFAECEFAWTSIDMNARVLTHDPLARGDYKDKKHPTQKPVAVMSWCLTFLQGDALIVDPFMGSGTTGVASVKAGKNFVGIEIDEGYFDIACQRVRDAYLQADMFTPLAPAAPVYEQQSMFGGDE